MRTPGLLREQPRDHRDDGSPAQGVLVATGIGVAAVAGAAVGIAALTRFIAWAAEVTDPTALAFAYTALIALGCLGYAATYAVDRVLDRLDDRAEARARRDLVLAGIAAGRDHLHR